jgi:hypothetical protein
MVEINSKEDIENTVSNLQQSDNLDQKNIINASMAPEYGPKWTIPVNSQPYSNTIIEKTPQHKPLKILLTIVYVIEFLRSLTSLVIFSIIIFAFSKLSGSISFVYQIAPLAFWALIPQGLISAYILYLVFKVKNLTKSSFYLGLLGFILVLAGENVSSLSLKNFSLRIAEMAGTTNQTVPSVSYYSLINISAWGLVAVGIFILVFNYKKFSYQNTNISRKALITIVSITFILILSTCIFVLSAYIGTKEKPFIGASRVSKYLDKKPVYFSYIPPGISHKGTNILETGPQKVVSLMFSGTVVTDLNKFMPIYENLEEPDHNNFETGNLSNGKKYFYLKRTSESGNTAQMLDFEANGLFITIVSIRDEYLTRDELIKIAESAY